MILNSRLLCLTAAIAALLTSTTFGVHWNEVGDAPEGVPARQDTLGSGPLERIVGRLNRGVFDHTDTYSIRITDPGAFYASTKMFFGGSALTATSSNADTRLWLWDENGRILLGNDDVNEAGVNPPLGGTDNLASFISNPSTFSAFTTGEVVDPTAANVNLVAGQKYLLSISVFSNDPDDAGGVDLVNLGADFDALHGPNTAAGVFAAWENATSTTTVDYTIALRGATYCAPVPEPYGLQLLGLGFSLLLVTRFRR